MEVRLQKQPIDFYFRIAEQSFRLLFSPKREGNKLSPEPVKPNQHNQVFS